MAGTCYLNGKAVGIGKEVCQADPNTTWVEDGGQQPVQDNRNLIQRIGGSIKENPLEALSYGLIFGGPIGLAGRGALTGYKALKAGNAMKSRTGGLMDRLFRKEGAPANPGFTMPQGVNQMARNTQKRGGVNMRTSNATPLTGGASEATRVLKRPSPLAIGGTAAGVGGVGMLNYATKDERLAQQQALQKQQLDQVMATQKAFDASKSEQAATKAEAERVAGLNPMQRMMENLKNPEFLNESMSGQPGDTRLNRLGQLMSYYGGTPKQRAAMGDPQKRFAEIESNVATNKAALAKAQATLQGKSPFGSLGTTGLAKGLESLVKERYPSTFGFGGIDDKDVEGVAARVASVMQQLAQENPLTASQPGGIEQIREAAFAQVEQELGL